MNCPKCGAELPEGATFCGQCGTAVSSNAAPAPAPAPSYENYNNQPIIPPYDHTAEYSVKDVSDNKVFCMVIYLMGTVGVFIALLAGKDSPYVKFHLREGLKLSVAAILLGICAGVLCWTFIVPIAAGIAAIVILVLRIIAFFQICQGKAIEPAIIRNFGFLK